jgi:hypothetical protein
MIGIARLSRIQARYRDLGFGLIYPAEPFLICLDGGVQWRLCFAPGQFRTRARIG